MCLAAPSRVVAVTGETATVECFGQMREVSLLLMHEPVAAGDYLLVQAGGFAFERVDAPRAEESLALMRELMGELMGVDDDYSARRWGSA